MGFAFTFTEGGRTRKVMKLEFRAGLLWLATTKVVLRFVEQVKKC